LGGAKQEELRREEVRLQEGVRVREDRVRDDDRVQKAKLLESGKFWKIEAKVRSSGLLNSTNDLKVAGSNLTQY